MKNYDVVIIGAGPGGYVGAIKAAQLGLKVALVEKEYIGGVCLNIGCIPTKALIKSAKVYKSIVHSDDYGIDIADVSVVKPNMKKIISRKDGIVNKLTSGVKVLLNKNGVDTYIGYGKVKDKSTVVVNDNILSTKNIIIATGASPIIPPIPGVKEALEKKIIMTSKDALSLQAIPKKLVIIGGGVIGIEFASIYANLGSEVTILERMDKILVNVDDEVRDSLLPVLKKNKINIITSANVVKVNNQEVTYQFNNEEVTIQADKILMSVGMKPNVSDFEHLGLEITKQGINVNDHMETNIKGIYAIGDVTGKIMLAHVASAQALVAISNIVGEDKKMDYSKIPACIYGYPEIAMVGMTEQEVKSKNIAYKVSKFPVAASGKALADGEFDGFIKLIVEPKYGELLGMHIIASNATEMIAEGIMTMELEGTVFELAKAVHPHPTLSEIVMEAAHGAIDKPIHSLK